jgi:lipopolysaccharide transport system ATP-binding protein
MSMQSDIVFSMEHVSKKFRKGEIYDSLRDLIPALARGFTTRRGAQALREREFWALRDINFEVGRGEAFGIIGSNGAGKSTILKLLSGILKPTEGRILVRGRLSALIEVGAGFHPDLTGRENVFLNGTILGMSRAEIKRKFDAIVDFAGLDDFIDTPVKRYSSGMYARLGFSVAAHVEPDLLIVDEVLSVGDYLFQQKCIDRMHEIQKSGTTVVFVSHNLHAVATLCRRSLLLERGRMIACGPTSEVIQRYLAAAQQQRAKDNATIGISEVRLRDVQGTATKFDTGDKAYLDVAIDARGACADFAIVIEIVDDNFYPIFDTDTARLRDDHGAALAPGDRLEATFELDMHLAAGTYHVNVYAHQYTVDRPFSTWRSAATFFVSDTRTVKGRAHLYPRLGQYRQVSTDPGTTEDAARLTSA